MKEDVGIPEPDDVVSVPREHGGAALVVSHRIALGVLTAVELDDQVGLAACKVGYVRPDRLLPNELETLETAVAQTRP